MLNAGSHKLSVATEGILVWLVPCLHHDGLTNTSAAMDLSISTAPAGLYVTYALCTAVALTEDSLVVRLSPDHVNAVFGATKSSLISKIYSTRQSSTNCAAATT